MEDTIKGRCSNCSWFNGAFFRPRDVGGGLPHVWSRGAHVLIWGLKYSIGEIIGSLIFLYPQKVSFSLKISDGRLIIWGR